MPGFGRTRPARGDPAKFAVAGLPFERDLSASKLSDLPGRKRKEFADWLHASATGAADERIRSVFIQEIARQDIEAYKSSQDAKFESDFQDFLMGKLTPAEAARAPWYDSLVRRYRMDPNAPLTVNFMHYPAAAGYIRDHIGKRIEFQRIIRILSEFGPHLPPDWEFSLDAAYLLYKYVIRGADTQGEAYLKDYRVGLSVGRALFDRLRLQQDGANATPPTAVPLTIAQEEALMSLTAAGLEDENGPHLTQGPRDDLPTAGRPTDVTLQGPQGATMPEDNYPSNGIRGAPTWQVQTSMFPGGAGGYVPQPGGPLPPAPAPPMTAADLTAALTRAIRAAGTPLGPGPAPPAPQMASLQNSIDALTANANALAAQVATERAALSTAATNRAAAEAAFAQAQAERQRTQERVDKAIDASRQQMFADEAEQRRAALEAAIATDEAEQAKTRATQREAALQRERDAYEAQLKVMEDAERQRTVLREKIAERMDLMLEAATKENEEAALTHSMSPGQYSSTYQGMEELAAANPDALRKFEEWQQRPLDLLRRGNRLDAIDQLRAAWRWLTPAQHAEAVTEIRNQLVEAYLKGTAAEGAKAKQDAAQLIADRILEPHEVAALQPQDAWKAVADAAERSRKQPAWWPSGIDAMDPEAAAEAIAINAEGAGELDDLFHNSAWMRLVPPDVMGHLHMAAARQQLASPSTSHVDPGKPTKDEELAIATRIANMGGNLSRVLANIPTGLSPAAEQHLYRQIYAMGRSPDVGGHFGPLTQWVSEDPATGELDVSVGATPPPGRQARIAETPAFHTARLALADLENKGLSPADQIVAIRAAPFDDDVRQAALRLLFDDMSPSAGLSTVALWYLFVDSKGRIQQSDTPPPAGVVDVRATPSPLRPIGAAAQPFTPVSPPVWPGGVAPSQQQAPTPITPMSPIGATAAPFTAVPAPVWTPQSPGPVSPPGGGVARQLQFGEVTPAGTVTSPLTPASATLPTDPAAARYAMVGKFQAMAGTPQTPGAPTQTPYTPSALTLFPRHLTMDDQDKWVTRMDNDLSKSSIKDVVPLAKYYALTKDTEAMHDLRAFRQFIHHPSAAGVGRDIQPRVWADIAANVAGAIPARLGSSPMERLSSALDQLGVLGRMSDQRQFQLPVPSPGSAASPPTGPTPSPMTPPTPAPTGPTPTPPTGPPPAPTGPGSRPPPTGSRNKPLPPLPLSTTVSFQDPGGSSRTVQRDDAQPHSDASFVDLDGAMWVNKDYVPPGTSTLMNFVAIPPGQYVTAGGMVTADETDIETTDASQHTWLRIPPGKWKKLRRPTI